MRLLRDLWGLLGETLAWLETEVIARLERLEARLVTAELARRRETPGWCDFCSQRAHYSVGHDDGRVREACHDCASALTAGLTIGGERIHPGWSLLRL